MTCRGWLWLFLSQLEKRAELCLGTFWGHLRAAGWAPLLVFFFFPEEKEGNEGWFMDWFHVTAMVSTWRWLTWGCRVNSSEPAPCLSRDLFHRSRMR